MQVVLFIHFPDNQSIIWFLPIRLQSREGSRGHVGLLSEVPQAPASSAGRQRVSLFRIISKETFEADTSSVPVLWRNCLLCFLLLRPDQTGLKGSSPILSPSLSKWQ